MSELIGACLIGQSGGTNRKYPEDDFPDKSFSAYADFDAMTSLDAVEAELCEQIVEQLCDDIFNATVANW